ncbi:MAG: hypothetical protein IIA64_09670 [Planctomycetes bacterium]|nr:hypothetical protein [Planctomycetota bacterium]
MMPLRTLLAVACTTALLGIATVPNNQASDNPSATDPADPIDTRTPAGIYAEYFPSPEADGADDDAPRLHRNLQTNPVFATGGRSPIDVQRTFSTAHEVKQAKRSAGVAAPRSAKRSYSPASTANTAKYRANQKLSIFDLARRSFKNVQQNRARNTVRNKEREVRVERAERARRLAQSRTFYRTNVRDRMRLAGIRNNRGSRQTLSSSR